MPITVSSDLILGGAVGSSGLNCLKAFTSCRWEIWRGTDPLGKAADFSSKRCTSRSFILGAQQMLRHELCMWNTSLSSSVMLKLLIELQTTTTEGRKNSPLRSVALWQDFFKAFTFVCWSFPCKVLDLHPNAVQFYTDFSVSFIISKIFWKSRYPDLSTLGTFSWHLTDKTFGEALPQP